MIILYVIFFIVLAMFLFWGMIEFLKAYNVYMRCHVCDAYNERYGFCCKRINHKGPHQNINGQPWANLILISSNKDSA